MTAPDTNLPKQRKRHRTPLVVFALAGVVVVALVLIFGTVEPAGEDAAPNVSVAAQEES